MRPNCLVVLSAAVILAACGSSGGAGAGGGGSSSPTDAGGAASPDAGSTGGTGAPDAGGGGGGTPDAGGGGGAPDAGVIADECDGIAPASMPAPQIADREYQFVGGSSDGIGRVALGNYADTSGASGRFSLFPTDQAAQEASFEAATSATIPSCTKMCEGMCSACDAAGAICAYLRAAGSARMAWSGESQAWMR